MALPDQSVGWAGIDKEDKDSIRQTVTGDERLLHFQTHSVLSSVSMNTHVHAFMIFNGVRGEEI